MLTNPCHSFSPFLSILVRAALGLVLGSDLVLAQEGPPPVTSYRQIPMTKPAMRQVSPGIFELGGVTMNKSQRTVTFPGAVNMTNGLLEYGIVGAGGKLHESLLRTEIEPYHIHLAALFLMDKPPLVITNMDLVELKLEGPAVTIWLTWDKGDREKKVRMEDWISNDRIHSTMSQGTWIYNGARVMEGQFTAHTSRSIVSLIEDFDALMNNPQEDRRNDEIWRVNDKAAPPPGTPVRITLKLESTHQTAKERNPSASHSASHSGN